MLANHQTGAASRVLLSNFGSLGDIIPFLNLGQELCRRGHDVTFATTANLQDRVEASGLAFRAIATSRRMEALHADPHLWDPKKGMKLMFDLAVELTDTSRRIVEEERLRSIAEGSSFVAIGGMLSFGLRLARERHAFPLMTVFLSPFLMRSRHRPPVLPGLPLPSWLPGPVVHRVQRLAERFVVDPERLPALNAVRGELGLTPIGNLSDWIPSPDRLCLMTPTWFAPPQPDWLPQARQTAFPRVATRDFTGALSPALLAFLKAGPRPVVATNGSTMQHGRDFFQAASQACRQAGQRAVLVASHPDQIPDPLPSDQIVVPRAPFDELLPRAAALIHHGGIGTCFEALNAGIPQIVIPNAFDQMDNAARIATLGFGIRLSRGAFAKVGATSLARMMTDSTILLNCAKARIRCSREDGILDACTMVEEMTAPVVSEDSLETATRFLAMADGDDEVAHPPE
jgi:UDP:flavonoid glycosyltransferase YjiC (YdhE family)